jgi:hypothetical protein
VVNGLGPARNGRPMMGASVRPAKPRHGEDRRRLQADSTDQVTGQPDPAMATREDGTGGDGPLHGDCGPAVESSLPAAGGGGDALERSDGGGSVMERTSGGGGWGHRGGSGGGRGSGCGSGCMGTSR